MKILLQRLAFIFLCLPLLALADSPLPPTLNDPELKLTLYAAEPMIQQPIGMAFDQRGRLLVIESHTHFRPVDWKGPEHDQIVALVDEDADGKADRRMVFYDQTDMTMDIALHPNGWVYVSTRNEILRLRDEDGDGYAEKAERKLVFLDTEGKYPHNGLSGLCFDKAGNIYFGMGENLGAAYTLRAASSEIADKAEGGNVFHCTAEGKFLKRIATGFWNPFGLCLDRRGNLFAVDNDPDSRPPCRLLHVVEGGDYGYQFRYGRSGLHPFVSWNGEKLGTMPMVNATGDGPSDIIYYTGGASEAKHALSHAWQGGLLVTSWVDHRIECHELEPRDGSFTATRKLLCEGGTDFRPVGMAVAADGSLYVSDWVKRDYQLHGYGRVWKISGSASPDATLQAPTTLTADEKLVEHIRYGTSPTADEIVGWLTSSKRAIQTAALWRIAREGALLSEIYDQERIAPQVKAILICALRGVLEYEGQAKGQLHGRGLRMLIQALADPDPTVALLALQWVADHHLTGVKPLVTRMLDDETLAPQVYYAAITTLARLDADEVTENEVIKKIISDLRDPNIPLKRKRLAVRVLPDPQKQLRCADLVPLLENAEPQFKVWLIHFMGYIGDAGKDESLASIALNAKEDIPVRTAALMHWNPSAEHLDAATALLKDTDADIHLREAVAQSLIGVELNSSYQSRLRVISQLELAPAAQRVLGETKLSFSRPNDYDVQKWRKYLDSLYGEPSVEKGRNVFHSPKLGGCNMCHRVEGIGNAAGPALDHVGKHSTPDYALLSLLQPNANVAPQYESYNIITRDSAPRIAFQLAEHSNEHTYIDIGGNVFTVKLENLVSRTSLPTSIMAEGLVNKLTDGEVRDLIAYLESLK
jgi:hypothetical protein